MFSEAGESYQTCTISGILDSCCRIAYQTLTTGSNQRGRRTDECGPQNDFTPPPSMRHVVRITNTARKVYSSMGSAAVAAERRTNGRVLCKVSSYWCGDWPVLLLLMYDRKLFTNTVCFKKRALFFFACYSADLNMFILSFRTLKLIAFEMHNLRCYLNDNWKKISTKTV